MLNIANIWVLSLKSLKLKSSASDFSPLIILSTIWAGAHALHARDPTWSPEHCGWYGLLKINKTFYIK